MTTSLEWTQKLSGYIPDDGPKKPPVVKEPPGQEPQPNENPDLPVEPEVDEDDDEEEESAPIY